MATFFREKITYRTRLTKEEVLKALYEGPQYKLYGLKLRNNRFRIQRIINYRDLFLPVLEGKIIEVDGAVIVKVKVIPSVVGYLFMIFWLFLAFLFSVLSVKAMTEDGFDADLLIPIGILLFGLILFYISSKIESIRSKKDLAEILNAEIM